MGTRVEREKLARRKGIIDSAERLFERKGYEQTTMDEIAKEAEFTKKTIYKYFVSKQEIYYEIAYRAFKALKEYTDDIVLFLDMNGYDKMAVFAERYLEFLNKHTLYSNIMLEMNPKPVQLNPEEKKIFQQTEDIADKIIFVNIVEEGIKDGSIRTTKTAYEMNFMIWGAINGIMTIARNKEKIIEEAVGKNRDAFVREAIQEILNTLKA
ncbi:TetR/AcrR family transcriptional regulator [Vallitalea pronyensis]|uniref:TetR/AcrR family transcriptional regulator n=1 Tax=Vallitalea pronyensis TaxID=1348613 RepID=A0A8J8SFB2_9FIRM|nr:TetR/AcrR family transcriptional regulator [Vallitalea pronyensis]QUI21401.1 TetR/AcrR family transcriptional regulator [Vallitalea pronyensis]